MNAKRNSVPLTNMACTAVAEAQQVYFSFKCSLLCHSAFLALVHR